MMDNLGAHKDPARPPGSIEQRGATLEFLPPYSDHSESDSNRHGRSIKKRIRSIAPRTGAALRATAQRAWWVMEHCYKWCPCRRPPTINRSLGVKIRSVETVAARRAV